MVNHMADPNSNYQPDQMRLNQLDSDQLDQVAQRQIKQVRE